MVWEGDLLPVEGAPAGPRHLPRIICCVEPRPGTRDQAEVQDRQREATALLRPREADIRRNEETVPCPRVVGPHATRCNQKDADGRRGGHHIGEALPGLPAVGGAPDTDLLRIEIL